MSARYAPLENETLSLCFCSHISPFFFKLLSQALITDFVTAKITDFGTSRAMAAEDVTMTAVGTPLFSSPEILRGEHYDETIDVYSFGLSLVDMATEDPILDFIGERWKVAYGKKKAPKQPWRFIRSMIDDGWRPVTEETPIGSAPSTINALIVRCCSHDPRSRPSFLEVLSVLGGACVAEIENRRFGRQSAARREAEDATTGTPVDNPLFRKTENVLMTSSTGL